MTSVVIVGASHAAAEVISSLKKHDFEGEIVLIGDENILPYQRPPLSKKYFTGEIGADHLFIKGPATYEAAGVIQKLGRTVVAIERDNKQVVLDDGERVDYDKLILAIGTRPRPALPTPLSEPQRVQRHRRPKLEPAAGLVA